MKILLGQINTTPRDFEGNFAQIAEGIAVGQTQEVDLIVFPELSIPGYLSQDLMYNPTYIKANREYLHKVTELTRGNAQNYVVVGHIEKNTRGKGKPFKKRLSVLHNGSVVGIYDKQLLPFYDVFDEGRWFEPGRELLVLEIAGKKWGFCICEDVWNDKYEEVYNYDGNPLEQYRQMGISNIVSINSSPFVKDKPQARLEMVGRTMQDCRGLFVYVNQIGGQDELVFDGNSFIAKNEGSTHIVHMSTEVNKPTYEVVEYPPWGHQHYPVPSMASAQFRFATLAELASLSIRDYVRKSKFSEVVVGSSGGIDSAVVLSLATKALGPENVHAVMMPSVYSSEGSVKDAQELHKRLGVKEHKVPIEHLDFLGHLNHSFDLSTEDGTVALVNYAGKKYNTVADENLQARLRDVVLMHFSNAYGALPLSTGNKTEAAVGYYTHFDFFGFAPLIDLYKLEVYDVARWMNHHWNDPIPQEIINKVASAELAEGQSDEASLLPYDILDTIVEAYIEHYISHFDQWRKWLDKCPHGSERGPRGIHYVRQWADGEKPSVSLPQVTQEKAREEYNRIIRLIDIMEFKRRGGFIGTKLSKVAFGSGRRIPIIKGVIIGGVKP